MANGTWTNRRTRGNYQLPIAVVFVLAVIVVLVGKAQNTLFDRARAQGTDWLGPRPGGPGRGGRQRAVRRGVGLVAPHGRPGRDPRRERAPERRERPPAPVADL